MPKRKHKTMYVWGIHDRVYAIFKISQYSRDIMQIIDAGVAYNNKGWSTDKFKKKIKKYNLDMGNFFHSIDRMEILREIYLNHLVAAEDYKPKDVPPKALEWAKTLFEVDEEKMERKATKIIDMLVDELDESNIGDKETIKEAMMKRNLSLQLKLR